MTTGTELWAPDEASVDAGPRPPERPRDVEAERILVATAIMQPAAIDELGAEGFDPADITTDWLRWTWFAVEELRTDFRDGELKHLAVHRQLEAWHADGRMPTRVPPAGQLMELCNEAHYGSASWYARRVAQKAVAARVVALGYDAILKGSSPAFDEDADVAAIQADLDGAIRPTDDDNLAAIGDLLLDSIDRATKPPTNEDRIPTGFMDLDSLFCGGFAPGQLVVIGARPAMGKSTVAADFARGAAIRHKIPTLFESLEMGKDELSDRILSAEARIALHHLKQGIATDDDMIRAARRTPDIASSPLWINDSALLSLPILRGRVRNLVRTKGLRLVIVDYLQLMQAPKAENRQQAVAEISRNLKLIAKDFGITVIVLCQLNRGPEQRQEKKPQVSDLRESGAIEQDADIVILLHREDAYEPNSPRAGEADLIVGKHRGGPTAIITVAFQGHYSRFVDMAQT
ncbi:replicative DNA helicase [Streptomyces europaeiscabiei]|uniref:replicative DNA helicase n=1 Tax=Streptomyces europaeiscabiei TaxID=146819 RepID=UPI0029A4F489|nr:replicative DNA helicase [Streptomyces europaeiscabiei]MDX3839848.1 replicative DNA helicase [Streptomyces europaeiscabiei]